MRLRKITLSLAMLPMLFTTAAMAEKGLAYDASNNVWHNAYGECWTTIYRDKAPADGSCFGEPMAMAEGDADGDGVVDSKDQCPGTPAGTQVDAKGCAVDSDGDGVADASDSCPGTPAGAKVDAQGCELDSDGDGVVDSGDRCPDTPSGATVDAKGCAQAIVLRNVHFQLNSGVLTGDSRSTLDKVAASLKARSDVKSIEVVGYTDSTGKADYNQQLSEKRAKAVADYLVSQGVDSGILRSKGMGANNPVADNKTAEGRAMNRRVELKLD